MLKSQSRHLKIGAMSLAVALCSMMLLTGLVPIALPKAQAAYAPPASYVVGFHTPAKINMLIYPTLGNPAIVKKGNNFQIEFDPRKGHMSMAFPAATDFHVSVTTTNGGAGSITRSLGVVSAAAGYSTVWPQLAYYQGTDRRVYLVNATIPYNLPADLYNVTVSCTIEGNTYSDSQTNCLDVITQYKEKFNFIQVSDIHVFGPECSYPTSNQKERSARTQTYDTTNGYGAIYYSKEIQQINRLHPDFCVFTGDYEFGQAYEHADRGAQWGGESTENEYEFDWFYQETQKLEVPVFLVPGNHDGYQYSFSYGGDTFDQDLFNNWTHMFGPLYYTFNYGPDNKFFAINSMDWPSAQRVLTSFGIILQPLKYMGAGASGGDTFAEGISQARLNAINVSGLQAQLGWLRDQLAASQGAKIRICAMHHDPWKADGSGSMWKSAGAEQYLDMGNGPGRLAYIRLMKDYKVALMVHGHDHSDYSSETDGQKALLDWTGGGGHVISANTTSSSFQADGDSTEYPGYRRVWVQDGAVIASGNENLNYVNPKYSWPFYAGTNVGGSTNLHNLSDPALQQSWNFTPDGTRENVTCTLSNNYALKPLSGVNMEFPMKMLSGGYYYQVTNGSLGETYDVSGSVRMCQVDTSLNSSELNKGVNVHKSGTADHAAPTGSLKINGGASTTTSLNVTLNTQATDTGGSGLGEMKISNTQAGLSGASWEQYQTSRPWTLTAGAGSKTVYVKYRDRAMPGNESQAYTATISYQQGPVGPRIVSVSPTSSDRGLNISVVLTGQDTNFVSGTTHATFTKDGGSGIQVGATSVQSATQCTASIHIDNTATVGKWDVGVTNGSQAVAAMSEAFTVLGPMITSVTPSSGRAGRTLSVVITGLKTSFIQGTSQVHFRRNNVDVTGITINSTTRNSPTQITANITIDQQTIPGGCDVSVYTAPYEAAPLEDGFLVVGNSKTWYLTEGSTNGGMETWVLVQNPGNTDANVTYSYMTDKGSKPGPTVKLPAHSRQTIFVADSVPGTWDVSTKVSADQDVIAERAMYGNNRAWGTDSIGVTTPAEHWYLAEGCTNGGLQTWVLIL
ncbi:MAG: metallophosphoesterase family protein, partial [Candidatus Geothermincolia bacterium]